MDQVKRARLRDDDRETERIVSAFNSGVIVVDANGAVIWMDATTRRRINGGLKDLVLPARKPDRGAVDCFLSTVDMRINGARSTLCVIQETRPQQDPGYDLAAAIQAVMADSSWLTRAIVEKLKTVRQLGLQAAPSADDVDLLTNREREVLSHICEGRGDGEMSRMLQLSPNTVRNHIVSLYRKIGVNRRGAAIIWARERGIDCLNVTRKRRRPPPRTEPQAEESMSY
jgi:DNA-binding CsgD family transcriptional regulator